MPQSVQDLQKDDKFMALSPEAKTIVMKKVDPGFSNLSPEAQTIVVGKLKKPEDTESFMYGVKETLPSKKDLLATGKGLLGAPADEEEKKKMAGMGRYGAMWKTGQTLKDIGKNIWSQQKEELLKAKEKLSVKPGTENQPDKPGEESSAMRTLSGVGHLGAGLLPIFGPMAAKSGEDMSTGHFKRGAGEAVGTLGQVLAPKVVPKLAKLAGRAVEAGAEGLSRASGLAPEVEVVHGVSIPRLASEVRPKSFGGRVVKGSKSIGLNEKGFIEFSEKQNAAVKDVIKKVAEQTSGKKLTGLLDNPADALGKASDAVEAQSRAMYQALDTTVDQIPGGGKVIIEGATPVIKKFLNKFPVTQATLPGGDILVDARGIATKFMDQAESVTAPFQKAQELRSALIKAAARATDKNMARMIYEGVEEIDSSMEHALNRSGNPQITKLWRDANKGWVKKYALDEVAQAVNKSIKGTPAEIGDAKPGIKASGLADRLNRLAEKPEHGKSVLEKAFGTDPEGQAHIMAIRRAVSLLEEAQKTKTGGGFSKIRVATHGIMAGSSMAAGHLGYGGAAIAAELGAEQIAKAMTSLKGAKAVVKLLETKNPAEIPGLRRIIEQSGPEDAKPEPKALTPLAKSNVGQESSLIKPGTEGNPARNPGVHSKPQSTVKPTDPKVTKAKETLEGKHREGFKRDVVEEAQKDPEHEPGEDQVAANLKTYDAYKAKKAAEAGQKPKLTALQTKEYLESSKFKAGKSVTHKGKNGSIIGKHPATGKITVKMEDGSIQRVDPSELNPRLTPLK